MQLPVLKRLGMVFICFVYVVQCFIATQGPVLVSNVSQERGLSPIKASAAALAGLLILKAARTQNQAE